MEKDDKKAIRAALLALLGGISWYLVDLIPTLPWTGRNIALLVLIVGIAIKFGEYLIKRVTRTDEEEVITFDTIPDTTIPFDLDMSDEPDEED